MITVSARIDEELEEEIEEIARKRGVDRSAVIRELLMIGIREMRLKEALELLRERKITVWKAAEMAEITYREILHKLKEYNIPFPLTKEEVTREIEEISNK